jgi:ADP-ribose pyrophosphatase YjhB (NUDIX family)
MVGDDRRYPARPIVGVGAILFDGSRVLLVERGHEPLKGVWSLAGGAVECGESLRQAVRREVLEETGLEVEPLGAPQVFERILHDAGGRAEYHYVLLDFVCRVVSGTLHPASDASRAEWVERVDLPAYNLTEGTLDVIERALADC